MPSPFPGMDPYLEGPSWPDFHVLLIAELHAALVAKVRPKYVVEAERRVYVESDPNDEARFIRPDVAVAPPLSEEAAAWAKDLLAKRE
jgi:hypothetical protein